MRNSGQSFKNVGAPVHKEWGQGVRWSGVEIVCTLGTGATHAFTDVYPFPPWIEQIVSVPQLPLHPWLFTRAAREAANWMRFVFRKVCVNFKTQTSTQSTGSIALSFTRDYRTVFHLLNPSYSIADLSMFSPGFVTSVWQSDCFDVLDYKGDKTFPTTFPAMSWNGVGGALSDDFTETEYVKTCEDFFQGMFLAAQNASDIGAFGWFEVSYEIDFYGPTAPQTVNLIEGNPFTDSVLSASSSSGPLKPRFDSKIRSDLKLFPTDELAVPVLVRSEVTSSGPPKEAKAERRLYSAVIDRKHDEKSNSRKVSEDSQSALIAAIGDLIQVLGRKSELHFRQPKEDPPDGDVVMTH